MRAFVFDRLSATSLFNQSLSKHRAASELRVQFMAFRTRLLHHAKGAGSARIDRTRQRGLKSYAHMPMCAIHMPMCTLLDEVEFCGSAASGVPARSLKRRLQCPERSKIRFEAELFDRKRSYDKVTETMIENAQV
jgi:hypothetical protein